MPVIPACAVGRRERKGQVDPWSSLANQHSRIGELWVLGRVSDSKPKGGRGAGEIADEQK